MTYSRYIWVAGLLLGVSIGLPVRADTKPDDKKPDTPAKDEAKPVEEPVLSVTAHTVTVNGVVLKYHATAGYYILKEEEGKPFADADSPAAKLLQEKIG